MFIYKFNLYYTMLYTKKCECGKIIEGLSESQVIHLLKQHKLGKEHKKQMYN